MVISLAKQTLLVGVGLFQNSSELKEVLDTQYKLYIRNGGTAGEMNLTMGLESSTPEVQLTGGKVYLFREFRNNTHR